MTRSRPTSSDPAPPCAAGRHIVYQEIDGHMHAHYAVRRLIHEAADTRPERILIEKPSSAPCASCAAGSSIPSLSPPEGQPAGVIDEILEERVVSSRGQIKPRGVRQKMSGFSLRKRGPVSRREHR